MLHISQFKWDTLQPVMGVRSILTQTGGYCVKTICLTRVCIDGEILKLLGELRQATTLILRMVHTPRYPITLVESLAFTVVRFDEGGWGDYTLPHLRQDLTVDQIKVSCM